MPCISCSSLDLYQFEKFSSLKRVTSDVKPWPDGGKLACCNNCGLVQKIIDQIWLDEIAAIYNNYEVYYQSNGEEQAVFNSDGVARKRSFLLTQFILDSKLLNQQAGKVLDYGCGNGEFLSAFVKQHQKYSLYGLDLSDKYETKLKIIPNFISLYNNQNCPKGQFDLISLIHTLEPIKTLSEIRSYLKSAGLLFIQVPNLAATPFDILIADHLLHFTPSTLISILKKSGFEVVSISTDVVTKEISVIAKPNGNIHFKDVAADMKGIGYVNDSISFNYNLIKDVKLLDKQGPFALFGTSISSTWLYGYSSNVIFFVDEDPNRIGRKYFGKPIYSPHDLFESNIPIYMPLLPSIAEKLWIRYPALDCFVLPS